MITNDGDTIDVFMEDISKVFQLKNDFLRD